MPPLVTAASLARDWLKEELAAYHGDGARSQETMVLLQDSCYGHRYSRPRTSRAGLATIVERPERIHASILGLASAYVRQGGFHAEGHTPLSPRRRARFGSSVPFRICKTRRTLPLTSAAATQVHGLNWMKELNSMCGSAEGRLASGKKELVRPLPLDPATAQAEKEKPELHEGDLYLCGDSKDALEGALGAVCQGVESVLDDSITKRAFVCIRPPGHHCSSDYPSGFCWLNNVHVGISYAAQQHGLTHAAIIDFDLHHGDGSQAITWAHNTKVATLSKITPMSKKTAIGYFSLHDINSYPCESGDEDKVRNASLCIENAHGQNIWNVHLQPWSTLEEFWALYEDRYVILLQKARAFLRQHSDRLRASSINPPPKAVIFLSAGFDASEWESSYMQRHKVNVPTDFYARFTRDVVHLSEEEGLGVDGRVVSVLEGGYSDRALTSGVLSHLSGLTSSVSRPGSSGSSNGLGQEMGKRLGRLNLDNEVKREPAASNLPTANEMNTDWWEPSELDALEKLINPPSASAPPKKARNTLNPTFISQTQASAAKIVSPPAGRRSLSGSGTGFHSLQSTLPPLPEAPPPPIDWATAAHELAKLLIPIDRQTHSCKPEELNAEASRIRRDRHSAIGLPATMEETSPVVDAKRMQLRDRKGKSPKYTSENEEEKPAPSRASRRRTVDPATLAQDNVTEEVPPKPVSKAPRRRLSVASSVSSVPAERPSTAGSISSGPAAAVPTMTGIYPLPMRKTRSPSKPRATGTTTTAGKPRVTKKVPPVPRVPSDLSRPPAPLSKSSNHLNGLPLPAPLAENDDKKNQDIDGLASDMKKMTIKLGVPKRPQVSTNDGEVPKLKKETTSSATAGNVKKKPAARGRPPKTLSNPTSTNKHKATMDQVAKPTNPNHLSSLAEENHGLPNAALKTQAPGQSEAVALGMSTDATTTGEQGNKGPEALVTSLVDLMPGEVAMGDVHGSIALEPTVDPRQISTDSSADRISDREANSRLDREGLPSSPPLRPAQEQGMPHADFQPSSIGSMVGGDGKPGAFAAPENPTIPAEVPVAAEVAPVKGFSSQSTVDDGNIDPALFSTAPSSQTIQNSQSVTNDHGVSSEQHPQESFGVIQPLHSSRPSTANSTSTPASPATTSATTPKRSQTRDNLPVWTSNSAIPFANNNNINNTFTHTPSSYQLQQEASEAPSQQQHPHIKRDKRPEIANLVDSVEEAAAGIETGKEHDLWEVPETPEHRKR